MAFVTHAAFRLLRYLKASENDFENIHEQSAQTGYFDMLESSCKLKVVKLSIDHKGKKVSCSILTS